MNFKEYQEFTRSTAIYPEGIAINYTILGLSNEAGEVCGKLKKYYRDGWTTEKLKEEIEAEIGDVLWYCARALDELGIDMQTCIENNVSKLSSRKERGVLGGSGDKR